jgi:hypothetical protein
MSTPVKQRRARLGRPIIGAERRERICASVEPSAREQLLELGAGNLSAGIARALEESRAWRALKEESAT